MARGRGRGGGGPPPQGGTRGGGTYRGRGGAHQWNGGRVLDEAMYGSGGRGAAEGGRGRGRGRGRGGATRGTGMRASGQNAVGYNYGTPSRSGQQTPEEEQDVDMGSEEEDDDIVIETHRSYNHIVKPDLEQNEPPQKFNPPKDSGLATLLPPSVSDLHARAPSNLVALERAQRAMQGQVAGLIPTGPKSAHVHRMYGTLDVVYNRNKHHQTQQLPPRQKFPLPVSSQGSEKKAKKKFERPAENSAEDPCIAGIPRSTPRRGGASDKDRFLGRGAKSNLQMPVRFEKASGEWRDGAWVRAVDGKEIATTESIQEAAESSKQSIDPFERVSGAGLGFHQQPQRGAPLQDDSWAQEREEHDEEDDPIAALLKAHPGSREMEDSEEGNDASLGFYESSGFGVPSTSSASGTAAKEVDEKAVSVEKESERESERNVETTSSDGEEVILIPHSQTADESSQMVESDSEEERQLDAIIRKEGGGENDVMETTEVIQPEETAVFFIDVTGEEEGGLQDKIQYDTNHHTVFGDKPTIETEETKATEWESDEGDEPNMTQKQPRGMGKKARNAAKKARRRERKSNKGSNEPPVAREGDSDLDWGSDGPPVKFRKQEDQESFVQGGALQNLSLNGLSGPRTRNEEDEMLAVALANSIEANQESTSVPKDARLQNTKDAILADYMANAMGADDDDDEPEEGEEGEDGDMQVERRDERKAHKKTDLDALLQFMNGMDGQRNGREMTMEDIAIEGQMQEEDEWMTDSDQEGSEEEEDETIDAAIRKEESKVLQEESDEEDEDEDSESTQSEKSKKPKKQQKRPESWSDEDSDSDSDDDEEDAFNRNFSWADADEDFIERLDKFARAKEGILKGRDRGARNRLFKAIESGDFGMLDDDDMAIDNDDPVFGLGALQPAKKGKNAKKTWKEGDLFADDLQLQWEKDRAQKAANKRKRAAERAAAAENPFHATQIKKGTKKMAKKAARAERRANRAAGGTSDYRLSRRGGDNDDDDDDDDDDDLDEDVGGNGNHFGSFKPAKGALARHATNLSELDVQIQLFLRDAGKTTLSLAPMDKRARAQVHLLANCYNLTSKSKGNGAKRFPTLIKNQRSGLNVNLKKINGIVRGSQGSFGSGFKGKGGGGGGTIKDRASGVGAHVPNNQEGTSVGFGAERIGEENIGHRLLLMMGWSEGSGVGLTKGAADPVGATIKVTKSGLGF